MPEAAEGTGESQPADDLRSVLASAVDASEKTEAPEPKAKPAKVADATNSDATNSADQSDDGASGGDGESGDKSKRPAESNDGKERGPDGKFVKKEGGEEAKAEGDAEKPEADKKAAILEPPVNWKAEDKETFKKLPAEAQKVLKDIVGRQEADYTRKTQAIAALKNEYEPVDKLFDPYREQMKQKGFTPRTLIEAWANVEKRLMTEPVEVIKGLIGGYKVDPQKLIAALGIKAAPGAEGEQVAPDPQQQLLETVRNIMAQEIAPIRQTVSGLTEAQRAAQEATKAAGEARVQNDINQFKEAKDDKGNLSHPHFDEVEAHMARLAQLARAEGQSIPALHDLYETAVWANTSTREKLLTAREQQAEETRKTEARAKAAQAKKASSSVTGAPGPGQASSQVRQSDKSLREHLEEAADELTAA